MTTRHLSYSEPFAVKSIEMFELDMEQHDGIRVIRETEAVMPKVRIVSALEQWPPAVSEALRWHLPAGETAVLQTTAIIDDAWCQSTAVVVQADGSAKQVEHPVWQQSLLMAAGVTGLAGMAGIAGAAALSGAGGPAPTAAAAGGSGLDFDKAADTVGKAAKFVAGLFSDDDDEDEDDGEADEEETIKKKRTKTKAEDDEKETAEEDADTDAGEESDDDEEEEEEEEEEDDDDDFDF